MGIVNNLSTPCIFSVTNNHMPLNSTNIFLELSLTDRLLLAINLKRTGRMFNYGLFLFVTQMMILPLPARQRLPLSLALLLESVSRRTLHFAVSCSFCGDKESVVCAARKERRKDPLTFPWKVTPPMGRSE